MEYLPYIVTAASIVGTVANSLQRRWCFCIWLCTNAFWCVYNALHRSYAQALLYAFNFTLAIIGLVRWKKKETIQRETAEKEIESILNDIEQIRRKELITDYRLDDALGTVCEKYCRNSGKRCFRHGDTAYSCANFQWRGGA